MDSKILKRMTQTADRFLEEAESWMPDEEERKALEELARQGEPAILQDSREKDIRGRMEEENCPDEWEREKKEKNCPDKRDIRNEEGNCPNKRESEKKEKNYPNKREDEEKEGDYPDKREKRETRKGSRKMRRMITGLAAAGLVGAVFFGTVRLNTPPRSLSSGPDETVQEVETENIISQEESSTQPPVEEAESVQSSAEEKESTQPPVEGEVNTQTIGVD